MSTLSPTEIYGYARGAGFAPPKAIIMTAIALAESAGGDPNAHCFNCFPGVTEDSRGLTQVNVDAHPQFAGWNLYDPATNLRAAFQISNGGQNFTPWSTYTSGSYTTRLGAATAAASGDPVISGGNAPELVGSSVAGSTVTGTTSGLNVNPLDGFGIPSAIASSVGKDALRVVIEGVLILGGASLVVVGLYRAVQPAVQKVASVAGDAAKATAAATAV